MSLECSFPPSELIGLEAASLSGDLEISNEEALFGETIAGEPSKHPNLESLQPEEQGSKCGCQQLVKGETMPFTNALTPMSRFEPSEPGAPALARNASDGRISGISVATIVFVLEVERHKKKPGTWPDGLTTFESVAHLRQFSVNPVKIIARSPLRPIIRSRGEASTIFLAGNATEEQ